MLVTILVVVAALVNGPVARANSPDRAASDYQAQCLSAIQAAEQSARLPPKLLGAIGVVESGRPDPQTGRVAPWPWTINVAGVGHFFSSKADAIAAVQAARASGIQSIDVGCMQVNLMHHPNAFASLEQAFDPQANAVYAAGFLTALFAQTGDWASATGAYHSQTPELSDEYRQRVAATWPAAARFGMAPRGTNRRSASRLQIDPRGVETPEFRARLAQDAADRAVRIAMGLVPAHPRTPMVRREVPGPRRGPASGILHASLSR